MPLIYFFEMIMPIGLLTTCLKSLENDTINLSYPEINTRYDEDEIIVWQKGDGYSLFRRWPKYQRIYDVHVTFSCQIKYVGLIRYLMLAYCPKNSNCQNVLHFADCLALT